MRKFIFALVVCFGVLSARASYLPSELTIRMWDYSLISVVFDDLTYNQFNSSHTITGISAGNHFIKIYRNRANQYGNNYGYPKMVFSGYLNIGPGKSISGMITNDFHFMILSEVSLVPDYNNHHGGHNSNDNYYDNYNNGTNNNYNNGGYGNYSIGMNDYDFMELKTMVGNTSFDDTKLTICNQAISANRVSSNQVFELMTLLTFESNKLDLAKFAYRNVIDKNRFYVVNNAFTFSSSIDDLNNYISGQ